MQLNKPMWTKADIGPFLAYLETYRRKEKEAWSRSILNTKLDVLAIPTKEIKTITKEILKGNYQSYLDLQIFTSYETVALYGILLCRINDFPTMNHYLSIYQNQMENWAHVDLLSFTIHSGNLNQFLQLSQQCLKSEKEFIRRLGLLILFTLIKQEDHLLYTLDVLSTLKNESAYYVIMMGGWLLSECIIRYEEKTLAYLKTHSMNSKIVNKGIQKCRESLRLTPEQKEALLVYKIK